MEPNVNDCSANAICPIVPSCAICIKWDTLAVEDYDDVDPYVPPPCEQQKLDQIKAEITARYMKEIQKLRQSITLSYAVKCLNASNVVDKVEASYDQKLYHYTLYYYDRAGRLVRTVSPKGVDINPTRTVSATPAHTFVSRFRTDSRGRMLVKTVPDGGSERYEYDKYGRLRFIVDAVQNTAASKRMTYFKYDALDRVVETGEVVGLGDEQGLETAIHYNRDDATWPTAADYDRNDVAVYVYDHPANTTAGNSAESGWAHVSSTSGLVQRNLRHRLSWAYAVPYWPEDESFANLSNVVRTFFTYDAQGNPTAVVNDIPHSDQSSPNGTARLVKRTDYRYDHSTGAPLAVDYQVHGVDNDDDRFQHRYEYDANGRLKIVETSRNGVMWIRDVVYDYNLDGSLRRETIGEDSVQGRDYTYTLLGQLKGINHPSLDPTKDPGADGSGTGKHAHVGKDAFGMSFNYHEDDFQRSYNTATSPFNDGDPAMLGVPQSNGVAPHNSYAGLMGAWSYRTQATGSQQVLRDGALLRERFQHDRIGRLRADTTYSFDGTNWVPDGDGGWGTRYVLDQNSNMVHIKRWAMTGSTTSVLYDDATLNLVSNQSNALATISDAAGDGVTGYEQELNIATGGSIDVDPKGRVTEQSLDAEANSTAYTSYDVPKSISRSTTNVTFVRDAFGQIARSDVFEGDTWLRSSYIVPESVEADLAVYLKEDAQGVPAVQEWSIGGGTRIGVHRGTLSAIDGDVYHRNVGHSRYELTDHLGSVRVILSDVLLVVNGAPIADLRTLSDYEPYGAMRERRKIELQGESNYRHAFHGMRLLEGAEDQAEYRTPFRLYDGKIGRWTGVDPILDATKSGYNGFNSAPYWNVDPYGLRPHTFFIGGFQFPFLSRLMLWNEESMRHTVSPTFRPDIKYSIPISHGTVADMSSKMFMREALKITFPIYASDVYNYWGSFDNQFMQSLGVSPSDVTYLYASTGPFSAVESRRRLGAIAAYNVAAKIGSGELDIDLSDWITIVDHSQGDAFTAGFVDVLANQFNAKVHTIYAIASKQPDEIVTDPSVVRSVNYYSPLDMIAPQAAHPENGSTMFEYRKMPAAIQRDPYHDHLLGSYNFIFDIQGKYASIQPVSTYPDASKSNGTLVKERP